MKVFLLLIAVVLFFPLSHAQQRYSPGQAVEVYDPIEKNWFLSNILKIEDNKYFIHYNGYDAKWDVWVDDSRIRIPGEKKESPVFFLIGTTEDMYKYYVAEKVDMLYLPPDSIGFQSGHGGGDRYAFRKLPGNDFLTGKQKIYESNLYAEWIDANSFMISRSHDKLSYYHRDKNVGTDLMQKKQLGKYVDSALNHIERMETSQRDATSKKNNDQQFNAISHFIKNYVSKKNDALLKNDITKWWNGTGKLINPLLKVYVCNGDYAVTRNDFGVILNKHVTALLVYKWAADGKCYVKWQNFGYENTGGAAYSTELKSWLPRDISFNMEGQELSAGTAYVVDCNSATP